MHTICDRAREEQAYMCIPNLWTYVADKYKFSPLMQGIYTTFRSYTIKEIHTVTTHNYRIIVTTYKIVRAKSLNPSIITKF